jgi:hypothetical protein
MIADLYKVLFEMQLLHEYFLTDPDQSSVFDPVNISNATDYVTTRQQQGRPSVTASLQFVLPAATEKIFRNYRLRLVNTYSGFKVVVKVTASVPSNGTTVYSPAITMPADCNLFFLIRPTDGSLGAITNGRMRREIGSLYYFNNGSVGGTKTTPVLSNPIPAKVTDGSYPYQQGELVNNSGSTQFAYYATNNTAAQFGNVSGDGFANESDRMVVGLRFNYTFAPTDGVTSAGFTLKDVSGTVIKTINVTAATPLSVVPLDFSEDAEGNPLSLQTLPDAGLTDPILYTLTVTGSGAAAGSNYSKVFNVVFYDDLTELSGCWGLIQVQTTVAGASYSLLDANGQLASPVFQIRCKSLPTFRRYINNTGQAISLATSLNNILVANGKDQLSTPLPVPLTYMPYFFVPNQWANVPGTASGTAPPAAGSATAKGTVYLPAPDPGGTMDFSNNQLSSLILVPVSPLFPLPQQKTQQQSSTLQNAKKQSTPQQSGAQGGGAQQDTQEQSGTKPAANKKSAKAKTDHSNNS